MDCSIGIIASSLNDTIIENVKYLSNTNIPIVICLEEISKLEVNFSRIHVNVKLIKSDFKDFSSQRNTVIDNINSNWVIFIDSDEIISYLDCSKLEEELNNDYMVGYIEYINNYNSILQLTTGRIINKNIYKYEGFVHEYINVSDDNKFITTAISLIHHGYDDSWELKKKNKRNLRLLAQEENLIGLSNRIIYYKIKNIYELYGHLRLQFVCKLNSKKLFYIETIELIFFYSISSNTIYPYLSDFPESNKIVTTNKYIYNNIFKIESFVEYDEGYLLYLKQKYYGGLNEKYNL